MRLYPNKSKKYKLISKTKLFLSFSGKIFENVLFLSFELTLQRKKVFAFFPAYR